MILRKLAKTRRAACLTSRALRLVVMGTTGLRRCRASQALLDAGHDVVAVYTQPPRPAGRGQQLRPTPVHEAAERLGLPVRTPRDAAATPRRRPSSRRSAPTPPWSAPTA